MPTIVSAPRPRALVLGVPEGTIHGLGSLFPTVRAIASVSEVHQRDWDVLVTFTGIPKDLSEDVYVVSFGDPGSADYTFVSNNTPQQGWTFHHLGGLSKSVALDVIVEDDLPRGVERLARQLAEAEIADSRRVTIAFSLGPLEFLPPVTFHRFLSTGDRRAVAGMYQRQREGGAWAWVVPTTAVDVIEWTAAAVEHFSTIDPVRFPTTAWARSEPWVTPAETKLAIEIGATKARLELLSLDEDRLKGELRKTRESVDLSVRRLLTARGETLVSAVADALGELGFLVQRMDQSGGTAGVEDLRVDDVDFPGWVALVEVRHANQAASFDSVRRLGRFADLFEKTMGSRPTALWYVASQMAGRDPSQRPRMLAAQPEDASVFGARGGLAIDTAELFRLLMSTRLGVISGADARSKLRASQGVFSWP